MAFGGVLALDGFALEVARGEIHGLIGPNGAGKTTAINAIAGLVQPHTGTLSLDGAAFVPKPRELVAHGIGRTFQTPAVFGDLTALENVMLGGYAQGTAGVARGALADPATLAEEAALRERACFFLERVGFASNAHAAASTLSFGAHRKMEVARLLMSSPRLILLDEPTAGLAASEVVHFAELLRSLRADGDVTVLLVEHNVPFVFGLCDRVTAMHEGRRIAAGSPAELRRNDAVVASYLGPHHGETASTVALPPVAAQPRPLVLELRDVHAAYGATTVVHGVSLTVGAGEVVALFGRNGAGKSTLLNTILGAPRARSGRILWSGRPIEGLRTDRVVRAGIGLVPQDRAVIARQSVEDNLALAAFGLGLSKVERRARHDALLTRFPRLAERRTQLAGSLSGGERQMLAIANVLMREPRLLVLDEPSIGLAPAIVDEVQAIVAELRAGGLPILIAEQNVTWVVPVADRAYLLEGGRIVREGSPGTLAESDTLAEHYLGKL